MSPRNPANLGINTSDLRIEPKEALRKAAELLFKSVELPATEGDLAPRALSGSGRRHLSKFVEGLGLQLTGLSADFAGLRLTDPRTVEERVERTREVLELGRDLHVPVITAQVGALTHPESGEPSSTALEALQQIGEYAAARNVLYAIRPTYDTVDRLAAALAKVDCPAIVLGLDPGALVMAGVNPLPMIERFHDRIRVVHDRDATAGMRDRPGHETRFGEGEVDFIGLMRSLTDADYHGPHIIRRTDSQKPIEDLEIARDRFAQLMK